MNASNFESLCEEFEAAWRASERPELEVYLGRVSESERHELLTELLQIELWWRRDEKPSLMTEDYQVRFPQHIDAIKSAFYEFETKTVDLRNQSTTGQGYATLPPDTTILPSSDQTPTYEAATLPPEIKASRPDAESVHRVKYFGEYELLDEIARGGMGVVYKARQVKLNRIVAIKMILSGQLAGEEEVQRFHTEAEAAANLDHPGIVPIYEIGEHDGQHYFSMGFVEGESLQDKLRDGPLPPKQAAELCRKIAGAISYAHDKGVIHRDLKPANVLIDANGEPKVTDFGLAKQVESDSDLTRSGAVMGTPSFMPPEQAAGKIDEVGPRADVYSLGAILYCLLTGRPPFQSANTMDVLLQVLEKEPVPPWALNPEVPKDLETICLKCLEKETERRYQTAQEFTDELGRFERGEPILARPVGRIERGWRWCRRNPVVAGLSAIIATVLLVVVAGVVVARHLIKEENNRQVAQRLVQQLLTAKTSRVPALIENLDPYREWADSFLAQSVADAPNRSTERLHASLALLPVDARQLDYLKRQVATASPAGVQVLRDALQPYSMPFENELWQLTRTGSGPDSLLQVASLLAAYDPGDAGWSELASPVAAALVHVKATDLGQWMNMLQPVTASLIPHLSEICRDPGGAFTEMEKKRATEILFDYASDSPRALIAPVLDAGPDAFKTLFPHVERASEQAIPLLRAEFDRGPRAKNSSAERHVTAAVALYRLGKSDVVWPLLRHPTDGALRTHTIHAFHRLAADPEPLIERLKATEDDHERRAIVLALGEYGTELADHQILVEHLEQLFHKNSDAGVHGASRWALSRIGLTHRVEEIEKQLTDLKRASRQGWYLNPIQQTFVLVDGTKPFQMGSPNHEVGREVFERQHQKRIGRKYAISATEVTNLQFRICLSDHEYWNELFRSESWKGLNRFSLYADNANPGGTSAMPDASPVVNINPMCAALFCNWLSRIDGIPRDQWCYQLNQDGSMDASSDFLTRTGYRLPTEAEWELAARAGSTSARYFAESPAHLSSYAWWLENAPGGRRRTGLLKPNDWGLFDVYGNVVEFCSHHDNLESPSDEPTRNRLPVYHPHMLSQTETPFRGGSHRDSAWSLRSAYRSSPHSYTVWETGFRPARTLPSTEAEFTLPELQLAIPVQVDPILYDAYVGNYQFPGDSILSITKQDGRLFAQLTGNPKSALIPMSENRFFAKEVPGDIEFVRDDDGTVIHLLQRYFMLKDIVVPRIR